MAHSATAPVPTSTATRAVRRGFVLTGIMFIAANLRAGITVVGPLLGEVQQDLGFSAVEASALIALPLLCFAVFSPLVAPIAARLGMERTLASALGVLATGLVIRSIPGLPWLWAGTALLGIAIATMNVLLPALLKRDFPAEVSKLTGLFSALSALVAATASAVAVPVAGFTDLGWRLAFGMWAGVALVALGVFLPQIARRTLPRHDHSAALDAHPGGGRSPWSSALGWQVTVFMGLGSTFFYTVLTWWPSIEETHGATPAVAGAHQGIMQVFSIGGSLLAAAILPRMRKSQIGAVAMFVPLSIVAVVGQLAFPDLAILWNAFLGVSIGGSIVIALAMFGLRTRAHAQAAALSGMAQSVGYLLAAGAPLLFGAISEATGSWTTPLLILVGLQAVSLVVGMLAARDRYIS
jgi:CP family cyanate transporter-like MFS transporter